MGVGDIADRRQATLIDLQRRARTTSRSVQQLEGAESGVCIRCFYRRDGLFAFRIIQVVANLFSQTRHMHA